MRYCAQLGLTQSEIDTLFAAGVIGGTLAQGTEDAATRAVS